MLTRRTRIGCQHISHLILDCPHALGLTDGSIADWQLAASSVASEAGCQLKYARLHNKNGHAWCPRYADKGQWLLIDLGVEAQVLLLSYFLNLG